MPHSVGIVPGGVTQVPEVDTIAAFLWRLNEIRHFIDQLYLPDVLEVARHYADYAEIGAGSGRFLDYGAFPLATGRFLSEGTIGADLVPGDLDRSKITESVTHSWYAEGNGSLHPSQGKTVPQPTKQDAYSWLKSPRYDGDVYEGGPLARMLLSYAREERAKEIIDGVLDELDLPATALNSVLGRHAARAIECKLVADAMADWIVDLAPGGPVYAPYEIPEASEGAGLTGAPRGALGHWIRIKDGVIDHYQCVVPTTWNASPKDDRDQPGPIEQAIVGTKIRDEENPFEIVRIVRSFDPCLACAVHMITPRGRPLGRVVIA